ncbi:transglycosylase SLT domain-containing protein [Nocardia carnea]|uniref:transglycosylase SLT domain-containing protein n=1 Tax=Nocardia carnea TaxID=37328 RepID=UPI0032AED54E
MSASLLAAQGMQESKFDPNVSSEAGAQGLAQFLSGSNFGPPGGPGGGPPRARTRLVLGRLRRHRRRR